MKILSEQESIIGLPYKPVKGRSGCYAGRPMLIALNSLKSLTSNSYERINYVR